MKQLAQLEVAEASVCSAKVAVATCCVNGDQNTDLARALEALVLAQTWLSRAITTAERAAWNGPRLAKRTRA